MRRASPSVVDTAAIMDLPSHGDPVPFTFVCYSAANLDIALIHSLLGVDVTSTSGSVDLLEFVWYCRSCQAHYAVEIEQYSRCFIFAFICCGSLP